MYKVFFRVYMHIYSNVPWETVSNKNNMYVVLTTTTLSRQLTMHLNDSSSIVLLLKTHSIPKSKFSKILAENTTIIVHEINKLQLQILETIYIYIYILDKKN